MKYLKLTTAAMEISDEPYYFKATKHSSGVWLFQMGDCSNNYMNHNDASGFTRWKDGYSDAGNRIILTHVSQEIPDDPFGLNGRSYGIGKILSSSFGALTGVSISNEINSNNRLAADVMAQLSMSAGNSLGDLFQTTEDITAWTFQNIAGQKYYLTSALDGRQVFLNIDGADVTVTDAPTENSVITVLPGTGAYAGKIRLCNSAGQAVNLYSGSAAQGFGGYSDSGPNEWFNLITKLFIGDEDIIVHNATKVSVSDAVNVPNGAQVILYTRVWNETSKKYEFYAVDYDGRLVPLYEDGGQVKWIGTQINTLLWDFTEYYYEGTATPNYYYELQNEYSGLYLAPQYSRGQVLSPDTIGINMNGRRYGEYYTRVLAWDDLHYDYSGVRIDDGRIVPCPMTQAEDFYFAVLNPAQPDELTTVATVDNDEHGITIKMFDYNGAKYEDWRYDRVQTDVLGDRTNKEGIATPYLSDDGYPRAPDTDRSIGELFTANGTTILGGNTANHLFLSSTYNESGYFEYNSTKNFAHLNDDGNFTVYNQVGTINKTSTSRDHGQFFPYNDLTPGYFSDIYTNQTDELDQTLPAGDPSKGQPLYAIDHEDANYHFGMELEASFMQSPDGLDDWGHDLIFEFAGDDDMWLYVDGMLVLDLGGVHPADVGKVNFRTGEVTMTRFVGNGGSAKVTTNTNLRAMFETGYRAQNPDATDAEVNEWLNGIFKEGSNSFRNYTAHTMKMLYMERGAGASNLHMRFNLTSTYDGQVLLKKAVTGTDKQDYASSKFPYQIFYYDRDYQTYKTVTRTAGAANGQTEYTYTGVRQITYENTVEPVEYAESYKGYEHVFFLRPGQTAEILFPDDSTQYYIRECGVDQQIYDEVAVNGEDLTPLANGGVYDFETRAATVGERKVVGFENHANPEGLRTLTVTKELYDEQNRRLRYEDDPTGFRFRVYIGEDLDYYRMDNYYVKNASGEYCRYDPAAQAFVSVGVSVFENLTEAQKADCTFTTSPSGAVDKIPADFTFEIRNLLVDTRFRIEERASDIPYGYDWIEYQRDDGSYIVESGDELNAGTIRNKSNPHLIVKNKRGWGLTVTKVWSDKEITSSHDNIYIGVFCKGEIVPGTLRLLRTEVNGDNPVAETSHYYFFKDLIDGAVFADYETREVALTDPVVDEDGNVTSYGGMTVIGGGNKLSAGAVLTENGQKITYSYSAVYAVGTPTGAVGNVRSDTVTNIRPGVRIVKTDENGAPLPGAVFAIKDGDGGEVGRAAYVSGEDGLVTYLSPPEGEPYEVRETSTAKGYASLIDAVTLTLTGETVTVGGDGAGAVSVSEKDETGTITVAIRNRSMRFSVLKTNHADGAPLSGVHFALYRQVMSQTGPRKDYFPMNGYGDLVTGADGLLPGVDETLPTGTYYLTETEARPGYLKSEEDVCFSIDAAGSVALLSGPADCLTSGIDGDGRLAYRITLTNRKSLRSLNLTPQTLVADFGLDIHYNVRDNNLLVPERSSYEYIGVAPAEAYDTIGSETRPENLLAETGAAVKGKYGTLTLSADGSATYRIDTMSFAGEDAFCLVAHVTRVNGSDADVYAFELLTYIPATTVYYEDDFVADENYHDGAESTVTGHNFGQWRKVTSGDPRTAQAADLASSDTANIFGFDPAYTEFTAYSNNSAHAVSVSSVNSGNSNKNWPYMEFDFAGTGFDLVSVTGCDTGMFVVEVYKTSRNGAGETVLGSRVNRQTVDTYYGYEYGRLYLDENGAATLADTGKPLYRATQEIIDTAAHNNLLSCSGMMLTPTKTYFDPDGDVTETPHYYDALGNVTDREYFQNQKTGEVTAAVPAGQSADYEPNFASTEAEGWLVSSSADKALYQIPVIRVRDLDYGTYRARIEPRFTTRYGHYQTVDGYDNFDLYVDAFRVYDPAGHGDSGTLTSTVVREAYYYSSEAFEKFTPLKKVVIGAETMGNYEAGDEAVEGSVVVDGNVPLDTARLNQYKEFGPNNELYLSKNMSVAFEICATVEPADVQVQLKKISDAVPTLKITYLNSKGKVFTNEVAVRSATDLSYSILSMIGRENITWTKLNAADPDAAEAWSSGLVIVSNVGEDESLLSVTNLKWTFLQAGETLKIHDSDYKVSVTNRNVGSIKKVPAFSRKGMAIAESAPPTAAYQDGRITMTVVTDTSVTSLAVQDEYGNPVDGSALTTAFEDLNDAERLWTVTPAESQDGSYTFLLACESDGLVSGKTARVTVEVDNAAADGPLPGDGEDGDGTRSGRLVERFRSLWLRFIELLWKILGLFGVKRP